MARATIADVARWAAVSETTVSNVLHRPDVVAAPTRERVLAAIEALGYVANTAARALRTGRTRRFALAVLGLGNPFFVGVAEGVRAAAEQAGASVSFYNTALDTAREHRLLERLSEQRLEGLIITPVDVGSAALRDFAEQGTPLVVLARQPADGAACAVRSDDVAGGRLAIEHLLAVAGRRLSYVGPTRDERYHGARLAASSAGVQLHLVSTGGAGIQDGQRAASDMLEDGAGALPRGVFCANDLIALGLVQALTARGVRVPQDVAVVGYDDLLLASATSAVELSSVHQPAQMMGREAVRLLLQEQHQDQAGGDHAHQDVVFTPRLVVRSSSTSLG